MKSVEVSGVVVSRINDLFSYIVNEYKAPETAHRRVTEIHKFLQSLGRCFLLAKCRRIRWNKLGYRCAVFDHAWVFAYQVYDDRIIIHDMEHVSNIKDIIE